VRMWMIILSEIGWTVLLDLSLTQLNKAGQMKERLILLA